MSKIVATVVTYNRLGLLKKCIAALRNQTHPVNKILVINNGSTDGTEEWLNSQPDIECVTQKNVGGAGGFSTAIQLGYKKGYEWVWCMDDDGAPKEDALAHLLAVESNELKLLNCAVINQDDKDSFVWNTGGYKKLSEVSGNIIEGIGHPFNGTFINRRIIERVGVPKAKFFLWGDETEYYYRIIKKNNIPVCTVANSVHYHPATNFSLKQDWDYKTAWKMYFYVRNRLHIHKTKFDNKFIALFNYTCFLAAFATAILLFQKTNKLKKLNFIFWPATDALKNNFVATPAFILEKLNTPSVINYNNTFINSLKNVWFILFAPSALAKKIQPR